MKKLSFAMVGLMFLLFGCGGGGSSSVSNVVNPLTDEAAAEDAVETAPWSAEPVLTADTAQKTTANQNIYAALSSVVASAQVSKKGRSNTTNIDSSVTGTNGGTADVEGTIVVETPEGGAFPSTTTYEINIKFDGYMTTGYSIHGEAEYTGTTTVTSSTHIESVFHSHGGFSYKDSTGVYSIATEMEVHVTVIDGVIEGTFNYVVNGETIEGEF